MKIQWDARFAKHVGELSDIAVTYQSRREELCLCKIRRKDCFDACKTTDKASSLVQF